MIFVPATFLFLGIMIPLCCIKKIKGSPLTRHNPDSGQPKRHLLTTGWSLFVSGKRLVAGDSVLFIRHGVYAAFILPNQDRRLQRLPLFILSYRLGCNGRDEKQQLLLGIRRASRQPTNISSSVLSSDSMQIGILAAAAHAYANHSPFTVFYNPRSISDF